MTFNTLDTVSLNDLEGRKFIIPEYQRGYRWTETQITKLLEDLVQFEENRTPGKTYCLQPLVVYKIEDNIWEVIDGQQRLTSIFLLAKYFEVAEQLFDINYATREDSASYLKNIQVRNEADIKTIDFYFMCNAYNTIDTWMNNDKSAIKKAGKKNRIISCLSENIRFIWYEVNENVCDRIEIFNRLNIGKIPLTNAELIKALFLKESNFPLIDEDVDTQKLLRRQMEHDRSQLALEWDDIEKKLHEKELWGFINKEPNDVSNRIDYLFYLYFLTKGGKLEYEHSVFDFFEPKVRIEHSDTKAPVLIIWEDVKKLFFTFMDWFDDREMYHLVGFLVSTSKPISEIYSLCIDKGKKAFKKELVEIIKSTIPESLEALEYNKNNPDIERVLLLFNILTIEEIETSLERISFHNYHSKNQKWSLEHIHAQDSELLTKKEQRKIWIDEHLFLLIAKQQETESTIITALIDKITDINDDILVTDDYFRIIYDEIFKTLAGVQLTLDMNKLGNLALLDKDTNSAFNNSVFEVKSGILKKRIAEGSYILPATRNVFLKYYSKTPTNWCYWSEHDFSDYQNQIVQKVNAFLGRKTGVIL